MDEIKSNHNLVERSSYTNVLSEFDKTGLTRFLVPVCRQVQNLLKNNILSEIFENNIVLGIK